MSEGFSNPIIGGSGSLVYPSIHSPNFVHSVSGWTINKDGSAEFSNLTIRGTFFGLNYIISANGVFFYTGTPALGNLIISIVPGTTSVMDPEGNVAQPGFTVGPSTNTQFQIISGGGAAALNFLENTASLINGFLSSVAGQIVIQSAGTTTVGHRDKVAVQFNSSSGGGSANTSFAYLDDAQVSHFYDVLDFGGVHLSAVASIFATKPGTGTSATNAAVGESWNVVGAGGQPAFQNGWVGSGGFSGARFRLLPNGIGETEIELDIVNATATGNSTVFTLPSGYFKSLGPGTNHQIGWNNPQVNNAASAPWLFVDGGGNVVVIGIQVANKEIFGIVRIPID